MSRRIYLRIEFTVPDGTPDEAIDRLTSCAHVQIEDPDPDWFDSDVTDVQTMWGDIAMPR